MDNFSKFYTTRLPSKTLGPFRQCLWAVAGIRTIEKPLDILCTPTGEIISAMPFDLYEYQEELLHHFGTIENDSPRHFEDSLTRKYHLYTIPPGKPARSCHSRCSKFWKKCESSSLANFHPSGVYPVNIGSNPGLLDVLYKWLSEKD